jgi:hypothetical protein
MTLDFQVLQWRRSSQGGHERLLLGDEYNKLDSAAGAHCYVQLDGGCVKKEPKQVDEEPYVNNVVYAADFR